jgi:CBS domain containing-hemolysin-like protein
VSTYVLLWIAVVAAIAGCLAATAARALRDFSRHELEELCQHRRQPERFADILRGHEHVALGMEMIAIFLFALAVAGGTLWCWEELEFRSHPASGWLLVVTIGTFGLALSAVAVWLPWSIARIAAARYLVHTWPLWKLLGQVCQPLVWSARVIDTALQRLAGRPVSDAEQDAIEEEIRTIVNEGHLEGLIEEDAREMIEGVIELGDAVVSQIMTPRTEMYMVQINRPWEDVVRDIIDAGHTRVPTFEKNRDNIVGILYSKDLLPELTKNPDEPRRPIRDLLRKPIFIPETKSVIDVLGLFQRTHTHIAIVLDEFGGAAGLVTIEDVLEEIVGEIDDEYDPASEAPVVRIDDDTCEAVGRAHVDEINAVMDFELPESEDFDTIGGFVFAEFGRVPATGESIVWQESVRVTILEATRRRVNRVRLERIPQESLEAV